MRKNTIDFILLVGLTLGVAASENAGGGRGQAGQFRSAVFLYSSMTSKTNSSDIKFIPCTGFIFSPRWILTAGHCLKKDGFDYQKTTYIAGTEVVYPGLTYKFRPIEASHVHPEYKPWTRPDGLSSISNDIALLKTKDDIKFNSLVAAGVISSHHEVDKICVAIGYAKGKGKALELLWLRARPSHGAPANIFLEYPLIYLVFWEDGEHVRNTGGPLLCEDVSLGVLTPLDMVPHSVPRVGLYTSGANYMEWVKQTTGLDPFQALPPNPSVKIPTMKPVRVSQAHKLFTCPRCVYVIIFFAMMKF